MSAKGNPSDAREKPESLSDALSAFRGIASEFGEESTAVRADETGVDLPMEKIVKLFPKEYVAGGPVPSKPVFVRIPDLYEKLRRGKIALTVQELASCVPAGLLTPEAFDDAKTEVNLPLADVVAALEPTTLQDRTPKRARQYDLASLRDPFSRTEASRAALETPSAPPVEVTPARAEAEAAAPPAKAAPPPLPKVEVAPPEVEVAPPKVEVAPPKVEVAPPKEEVAVPEAEAAVPVAEAPKPKKPRAAPLPAEPVQEDVSPAGGVDLNVAGAEQLRSLEGMTPALAVRIVRYREEKGPFTDIFALADVPGVGRKTFKKITGMAYSKVRRHRALRLATLLGIPAARVAYVPGIAGALAKQKGFEGCIISDRDGVVVAQCGAEKLADPMSAVAPDLTANVLRNVEAAGGAGLTTTTVATRDFVFSVARSGVLFLTAIHEGRRVANGPLSLLRTVAAEMEWALSHRAYVGRKSDAAPR